MKLRHLSTFSGAGGMDIGIEAAGFETIARIEMDKIARSTYRLNRPELHHTEFNDVLEAGQQLKPEHFSLNTRDLDLITAGPPCQPFSTAAQWTANGASGMLDKRSLPLHGLFDLINTFLPKVVFIENVKGFIEGKNSAKQQIENAIRRINGTTGSEYKIQWNVVNAADYGVPQNRHRALIIISRVGTINLPEAKFKENPFTAWDAIGENPVEPFPNALEAKGKWADLLPTIPEGMNYQWHTPRGGGLPLFGYRTRYWNFLLKLSRDRPSWTLPASPGPSTGPFHWDNRPLTPHEMATLQTFPRNWKFEGSIREQVRQIGNATPPLLAEVMGQQIVRVLKPETEIGRPIHLPHRSESTPPPTATEPVPFKYYSLIGNHPAHLGTGRGPNPVQKLST